LFFSQARMRRFRVVGSTDAVWRLPPLRSLGRAAGHGPIAVTCPVSGDYWARYRLTVLFSYGTNTRQDFGVFSFREAVVTDIFLCNIYSNISFGQKKFSACIVTGTSRP
jgi:hypothetical protein